MLLLLDLGSVMVRTKEKMNGGFIDSELLDEIIMGGISYGNIWSPRHTRCDDKVIS